MRNVRRMRVECWRRSHSVAREKKARMDTAPLDENATEQAAPPAAHSPHPPRPEKECLRCGRSMPAAANFCTECDSYQDWRRHLPGTTVIMSALIAVLAIIGGIVPAVMWLANYGSDTELTVLGGSHRKEGSGPVLWLRRRTAGRALR